ncbi:MAG: thiamine phosphate synthase [Elusimicrobiota bacterium]|jgi:thiamine-phosphate pyrophosphorylase|nr:thiamine phosphate synthase [Elusimicrobiota bacterium]
MRILPKGLYAITAQNLSAGRDNIDVVKQMLLAQVKVLQYREKYKTKREKYAECKIIRELTKEFNCCFIVNDDIDIALSVKSDGVHLGQDDLPILEARKILGADMIIGISTHNPAQAQAAVLEGADYIGVGPIFKTFTKDNVCDPVGVQYLDYCIKNIKIPKVAIGGIKLSNLAQIAKFKSENIAMVSEITSAKNIQDIIAKAKKIIDEA